MFARKSSGSGHLGEGHHRNVARGGYRAAVFGVSDGLVSNVALILGVAGASSGQELVRVAGIAGLIAGAVSMAAGEYISMQAQRELLERELDMERREHAHNPEHEVEELAEIYESRGVDQEMAREMASNIMADPEKALEVHAREEMGIDPNELGNPMFAATTSFFSFALGAVLPLLPWFFGGGNGAIVGSIILGVVGAVMVGSALALATSRSILRGSFRQVAIAAAAAAVTFGIGSAVGVGI
ncbi:VIT1/CCC1 transporter family protein [Candidatus Poriferisocius sp.]|uniref:VIT1/CCC1 transporter family protein n=1 Tax=Candidatus Poriferisocius sp. TaxID=3101276 RepID=UPI003B028827